MTEIHELEKELRQVEDAISEAKARMPAHSAKPDMMNELIELEDQRERLLEQIEHTRASGKNELFGNKG